MCNLCRQSLCRQSLSSQQEVVPVALRFCVKAADGVGYNERSGLVVNQFLIVYSTAYHYTRDLHYIMHAYRRT